MSILTLKACSAFIKGWDEQPIIIRRSITTTGKTINNV
jgi:hypothetical protein